MKFDQFIKEIRRLDIIITSRIEDKRLEFIDDGYKSMKRIQFEYIDLDDIFKELIEIIAPAMEYYNILQKQPVGKQLNRVFIAALCEITKNGFSQGGILKQIDEYIGFEFIRSRYYPLLKSALKSENIKTISQVGHKYEATLVYESGIPKQFHRDLFKFFKLYWKWMKGIETEERRDFLRTFVEFKEISDVYVYDKNDYNKMKYYREQMNSFQEKVIKTCIRLDKIYSEIDKIDYDINESNIKDICFKISEKLGYNINLVVRAEDISKDIIESSHIVGFMKFQKILKNLLPNEEITLPTGRKINKGKYYIDNFICGIHIVKNIKYEVIYPFGLSCNDYLELPRDEVIKRNDYYIYTSNNYFEVEVDGNPVNVRELIWNNTDIYIYVGKVPRASCAYIDGFLVNGTEEIKIEAFIRKYWDRDEKKNKLILCLSDIKIFNPKYSMKTLELQTNISSKKIIRSINQKGHRRIRDKNVDIETLDVSNVIINAAIDGKVIATKEICINDEYIYSLQTGLRINDQIEWNDLQYDTRLIIFSKNEIIETNIELIQQDTFLNMFVYVGKIDLNNEEIIINHRVIEVVRSYNPIIKMNAFSTYIENQLVVQASNEIRFKCINCNDENMFIKIAHGDQRFKGKSLNEIEDIGNFSLSELGIEFNDYYGKWSLLLFKEQEKIYDLSFTVLANIDYEFNKKYYLENEEVTITVSSAYDCFLYDGEFTNRMVLDIGKANLSFNDNFIVADNMEVEVLDYICNLPYRLTVKPEIWGVRRLKDKSLQVFDNKVELDYIDDKASLVLCSTCSLNLTLIIQDTETEYSIEKGINNILWHQIINDWKIINYLDIRDQYDHNLRVRINYNPSLKFAKYSNGHFDLSLVYSYTGPIGVELTFNIFINGVFRSKFSEKTTHSNYEICNVIEEKYDNVGDILSVEARINNEDAFELVSIKIKEENLSKIINLIDYLKTLKLLNLNYNEEDFNINLNLNTVELLKYL
ncbi:hypothetical protein [Tissierella sp. Yu-01]|uniref:hypothetical protein n=1 Tax=Tissierella sp. Yu-01 TaxID=3035694 RepID=UPI00240D8854|nr:hypothetical protein [Tissierella sp. Yu-01]WFA10073.1 hypothetical protein P3962_05835 [Tissierella sp. Yu-01]